MATYEELSSLPSGDTVSLDLMRLWEGKYDREVSDNLLLSHEGRISISPNEDEEEFDPYEYPYIDIYTDRGPVACDGETCSVIAVDSEAETVELKSYDYGESFVLSFDDAAYCVVW